MRHFFRYFFLVFIAPVLFFSCNENRVHEHKEWAHYVTDNGWSDGCMLIGDHTHESIHYYNLARCSKRFSPASTFKIFNSLAALETGVAFDDQLVIKWDSIPRRPTWDKDLTMREAFKVSCLPYYQEIARRVGYARMKGFLDTVKYGSHSCAGKIDEFWLNDTLQISADEQLGFLKKMYFHELPFAERTQRIVKTIMLMEETPEYRLYYKTGTNTVSNVYWIVGIVERIVKVKEQEGSMNKGNVRNYPYFFAMNFSTNHELTMEAMMTQRLNLMHALLSDYGALPKK
ncbi:MAG: class D beta-lactamase [Chitinophagia bacterium]|nr:class D beta-lactamase [Chitinophagia bacterium]